MTDELNNINVLGNDVDIDSNTLSVTGAIANSGIVAINVDGTLNYTPNPNFSGTDTIIYQIDDGSGGIDTATLTIEVVAYAIDSFGIVESIDQIDPITPQDTAELEEEITTETEDPVEGNEPENNVEPASTQSGEQPDEGISVAQTETTQPVIPYFGEDGTGNKPSPRTSDKVGIEQAPLTFEQNTLQLEDNDLQVAEVTLADDSELWEQIDLMKQQMNEDQENTFDTEEVKMQFATGATTSLTAGFVSWVLRGGSLMASFLSSVPLFKQFDPIPILSTKKDNQ